jgi:hypothetical protein
VAVTRTSVSTSMASGLADITATYGSGAAAGNLAILITETANQLPAAVAGITAAIVNFGVGTAGAAAATMVDVLYLNSVMASNITNGHLVSDSGDHQNAIIITFSGHDTITAPNWLAANSATPATTSVTMTQSNGSFVNVKTNDILLAVIATDRDSATVSTNTSASWSNVTGSNSFIANFSSATGAGGGIIVNELDVTADATAAVSFSCSITSSIWAGVILLLKAPSSDPPCSPRISMALLAR